MRPYGQNIIKLMKNVTPPAEQARKYISKIPPTVSGADGHRDTFKVACVAVNGFGLNESDALLVLSEWNTDCDPPWSRADLFHKIRSAAKSPSSKRIGYLLTRNGTQDSGSSNAGQTKRPPRSGFSKGTAEQLSRLAEARPFGSEGLELARILGLLVFGDWYGQECFGVTDKSGRVLEIRRVDQQPFPAFGTLSERKSHAIRGSQKAWPVGIMEAVNKETIILLEGMPDFLEAHNLILAESGERPELVDKVAAVAMLSSSPGIHADALRFFQGKRVRIFPHAEGAGVKGADKWRHQLVEAGAGKVDFFSFEGFKVNDLWEYARSGNVRRLLP